MTIQAVIWDFGDTICDTTPATTRAFAAALAGQTGARLVTGDPEFRVLAGNLDIHWLAGQGSART